MASTGHQFYCTGCMIQRGDLSLPAVVKAGCKIPSRRKLGERAGMRSGAVSEVTWTRTEGIDEAAELSVAREARDGVGQKGDGSVRHIGHGCEGHKMCVVTIQDLGMARAHGRGREDLSRSDASDRWEGWGCRCPSSTQKRNA